MVTPDSTAEQVLADSPASYWPLSETVAATTFDYVGSHHGAQNGGLTLGVVGPRPPAYAGFSASKLAYQFNGTDTFIDCGTAASLSGPTDFTVEVWINTTNGICPSARAVRADRWC